jgi:enoyl-CoA hydratase/carnithine racemase
MIATGCADGVGHIEICRPEKKNALTSAMGADMLQALHQLEADPTCHAVILSGRGGDYSAGADLHEPRDPALAGRPWADDPHARLLRAIASAKLPVIAAVDGWAIGLGLGAVGAATYAVAGAQAQFSLPEIRFGYLAYAVLPHLVYRTPAHTVLRWAVSGSAFGVDEARTAGLVTHVVPAGTAVAAARRLAAQFAGAPRQVVEQAMDFVRECRAASGADRITAWGDRGMDQLIEASGGA